MNAPCLINTPCVIHINVPHLINASCLINAPCLINVTCLLSTPCAIHINAPCLINTLHDSCSNFNKHPLCNTYKCHLPNNVHDSCSNFKCLLSIKINVPASGPKFRKFRVNGDDGTKLICLVSSALRNWIRQ